MAALPRGQDRPVPRWHPEKMLLLVDALGRAHAKTAPGPLLRGMDDKTYLSLTLSPLYDTFLIL